jgi:hypothetical protein
MKTKTVLVFLCVATLVRCLWLVFQGVSPQEAYYWMCSERLAAAFFDGPPGTAFLVKLFGFLPGDGLLLPRFVWPVFGALSAWLAWSLARSLYDDVVAGWVLVTFNAIPVFNEHCVTVGPWMPALALALGGVIAARHAMKSRKKEGWLVAAVLFAAAILFRYEAVLLPIGFCIALIASIRRHGNPDFTGFAGLALLILLPVAVLWMPMTWNASLEWVPVAAGTFQTWWQPRPSDWLQGAKEYFQEFSLGVGVLLFAGIFLLGHSGIKQSRARFLLVASGPAVVWALYQFVTGREFSTAAWLGLVPVLIHLVAWGMRWRGMAMVGYLVVVIALLSTTWMLREEGGHRGMWPALAGQLQAATREMPATEGGGFLIAENAEQASVLAVYLKAEGNAKYPPVFVPESPALISQFGIWPSYADFIESDEVLDEFFTEQKGYNPFIGRNALYVGSELPQTIQGAFAEVQPLKKIQMTDGRSLTIFLCLDYQTLPL